MAWIVKVFMNSSFSYCHLINDWKLCNQSTFWGLLYGLNHGHIFVDNITPLWLFMITRALAFIQVCGNVFLRSHCLVLPSTRKVRPASSLRNDSRPECLCVETVNEGSCGRLSTGSAFALISQDLNRFWPMSWLVWFLEFSLLQHNLTLLWLQSTSAHWCLLPPQRFLSLLNQVSTITKNIKITLRNVLLNNYTNSQAKSIFSLLKYTLCE